MKNWFKECRKMVKMGVLASLTAGILSASAILTSGALPVSGQAAETETVGLYINGVPYSGTAVLYRDITYVERVHR